MNPRIGDVKTVNMTVVCWYNYVKFTVKQNKLSLLSWSYVDGN